MSIKTHKFELVCEKCNKVLDYKYDDKGNVIGLFCNECKQEWVILEVNKGNVKNNGEKTK